MTSDRPTNLRLPPPRRGVMQTVWVVLGILMFGGFFVAGLVWTLPALVSDWQIHAAATPLAEASVTSGSCTTRVGLNFCDATLRVGTPHGTVSRSVNYVFAGLHAGDWTVRAMADPARPELVSTDLGLSRLWNRTIVFLLGEALLVALTVLPLVAMVRNRRDAAG